jgi:DNA polymerase I
VDLIEERDKIRKIMREVKEGSTEYKVLDSRQKAIKIITNAVYGYTGWAGARWYAREVAEATTAWGRITITSAIDKAEKLGLSVIYSDTDSLFVSYKKDKVEEFLEWIKNELSLEAKIDKIFLRIIFTEAKKKYAGLTEDGKVEFVGLEAVRGDWSTIAKEVQSKVIERILKTGSKDEGLKVLNEYIDLLRKASVDVKKLVIWKQITRPIEEYEATAPHVVVAKYLIKSGWKVDPGDKVGYVVVKGSGRIYTRVKPYFEAKLEEIDWQYYIENQVIAACERILEAVGIDVKKVGKYKQSKLFT